MAEAILLTGPPGCGKTTAIRSVLSRLQVDAGGFYTEEIREAGARTGFRLVTLESEQAVLASVRIRGRARIGKYGVDLAALEATGVRSLEQAMASKELVVVDEIGPMELLSSDFRDAVLKALESPVPLLGTLMLRSAPFPDALRAQPGVTVVPISRENWSQTVEAVVERLRGSLGV